MRNGSSIYTEPVWAKGCNYIVGQKDDLCLKCGKQHNLTAEEAGQNPFTKEAQSEKADD